MTQTVEAHRERRRFTFFSTLGQDLRSAVQTLTRAPGIPALYESKGRAYVLFMSPAPGAGQQAGTAGGGAAPAPAGPYGYIAFALPAR